MAEECICCKGTGKVELDWSEARAQMLIDRMYLRYQKQVHVDILWMMRRERYYIKEGIPCPDCRKELICQAQVTI